MGGYLAYPEYKESGVEWLGEIPAHWDVSRLKFTSQVQPSNVDKKSEDHEIPVFLCNYSDVYNHEEITSAIEFMKATATSGEMRKFLIEKGDVIITKDSESRDDIAVPAYVAEDFEDVLCGYHLTQIKPIQVEGKYLFRLFQSEQFNAQFIVGTNGVTRFGLPQSVISNVAVSIPPIAEQRQIAAFLDYKTGQIDALIAKKEALLEKLAEKRTALISQAVTKGLDPTVPMQDSGIPWLGDIPAHWEPIRLKFLILHIEGGFSPQCYGFPPDKGGWGVLKTGCVNGGVFNPLASKTLPEDVEPPLSLEVHQGDVLMSRASGSLDLIGSVALVEEQPDSRLLLSDKTFRLSLNCEVCETQFFVLAMGSPTVRQQIHQVISGAEGLANNIAQSAIRELVIALPPLIEQKGISNYLKNQFLEVDKQATYVLKAIESFKEYRTALITNAVTGKIDVRDIKLPTPIQAEAA